ncbi:MAG: DUF4330 domain-containing protein [Pseudanabaenaceae cyanobacterium]
MRILDQQGRLLGKFNVLDIGAIALILVVLVGIVVVPGNGGYSIAQLLTADNKAVEVEMVVRGLSAREPEQLIQVGDKVSVIIRNQPRGEVTVKSVTFTEPKVVVAQQDGKAIVLPDPRARDTFQTDVLIVLTATAKITNDGVIFGNEKVKVGTPIDIEGARYIMRGSTMAVRF